MRNPFLRGLAPRSPFRVRAAGGFPLSQIVLAGQGGALSAANWLGGDVLTTFLGVPAIYGQSVSFLATWQFITVPAGYYTMIDSGAVRIVYTFSQGHDDADDTGNARLAFLDADDAQIRVDSVPAINAGVGVYTPRQINVLVPSGTRKIEAAVYGNRVGGVTNKVYFKDMAVSATYGG